MKNRLQHPVPDSTFKQESIQSTDRSRSEEENWKLAANDAESENQRQVVSPDADLEEEARELADLKEAQCRHRKQLQENREAALQKKRHTKQLVIIGKAMEQFFPDMAIMGEEEIKDFAEEWKEKSSR